MTIRLPVYFCDNDRLRKKEIEPMWVSGGCHCGLIRYEADVDPERVTICHCSDCQNLTGTAYRVSVVAQCETFHLIKGQPKQYAKRGDSGQLSLQFFCAVCGSHLYRHGENSDMIGIRLGSVDQRHQLTPTAQIWCHSALSWTQDLGGLPRYDKERRK